MQIINTPAFYVKRCERDFPVSNASPPPLYINKHLTLPSKCEASHLDGFGEGFEQRPIKTPSGEIYVSLWSSNKNWSIMTQDELEQGQQMGGMKFE